MLFARLVSQTAPRVNLTNRHTILPSWFMGNKPLGFGPHESLARPLLFVNRKSPGSGRASQLPGPDEFYTLQVAAATTRSPVLKRGVQHVSALAWLLADLMQLYPFSVQRRDKRNFPLSSLSFSGFASLGGRQYGFQGN